jgi:moderate conductance mechanosensitive channel
MVDRFPLSLHTAAVMLAEQAGWVRRLDELHLLTPLRIVLLVVGAVAVSWVVSRIITRTTTRVVSLPGADRERARVRQHAMGTVLRSTIIGIIWAAVVLTVFSELGVNIGAFIATATVVGGAIAFGAQTLVRDAIAGFFVIAEDQYGVGDAVDVGHATGVVERISLRSVRLRDFEGRIWHVPHGGVVRTANLSKSPKALLDLEVARSSRLETLEHAAQSLCDALVHDESLSGALIGAPKVEGLIDVRDDRLIFRVAVETRPGEHDRVRKRWRVLALDAFQSGALDAPAAPSTVINMLPHPPDVS